MTPRAEDGLTLTELVIGIGLASVLFAAAAGLASGYFTQMRASGNQFRAAHEQNMLRQYVVADVSAAVGKKSTAFAPVVTYPTPRCPQIGGSSVPVATVNSYAVRPIGASVPPKLGTYSATADYRLVNTGRAGCMLVRTRSVSGTPATSVSDTVATKIYANPTAGVADVSFTPACPGVTSCAPADQAFAPMWRIRLAIQPDSAKNQRRTFPFDVVVARQAKDDP